MGSWKVNGVMGYMEPSGNQPWRGGKSKPLFNPVILLFSKLVSCISILYQLHAFGHIVAWSCEVCSTYIHARSASVSGEGSASVSGEGTDSKPRCTTTRTTLNLQWYPNMLVSYCFEFLPSELWNSKLSQRHILLNIHLCSQSDFGWKPTSSMVWGSPRLCTHAHTHVVSRHVVLVWHHADSCGQLLKNNTKARGMDKNSNFAGLATEKKHILWGTIPEISET